ncbi:response regulator [Labrys monachus]|uniref:DNA-binding NarL/FixJ family response regulator n=1 Tax=Labrys monachus TaxID=217067 RepID=A0ABU0FB72_9HYPH|nr:response regulator [Labrys monachus]MDQ0391868.1 DNA-binding NarL/FixJ family response regulator [Labrys monachus]
MSDPLAPGAGPRSIVLVVDDSADALGMLTDALEPAGFTVLASTSGTQALAVVGRVTPDIVLLDAVMPGMDGFETCRRLKAMAAIAAVPVIFMTGLSETEHVVRGLEAGGVDYLTKPINIDELLARIRVHLANARAYQSAHAALDATGRFLFAANRLGEILWSTPQAHRLLAAAFAGGDGPLRLPPGLVAELRDRPPGEIPPHTAMAGEDRLQLSFMGRTSADEFLFRLTADRAASEQEQLRSRFALTNREAEVLVWIARGKSNRDIGEILGLSPRTVNKHLEQIYVKLGVENRASAAVLANSAVSGR